MSAKVQIICLQIYLISYQVHMFFLFAIRHINTPHTLRNIMKHRLTVSPISLEFMVCPVPLEAIADPNKYIRYNKLLNYMPVYYAHVSKKEKLNS